jgi:hypothetical protein
MFKRRGKKENEKDTEHTDLEFLGSLMEGDHLFADAHKFSCVGRHSGHLRER